MKAALWPILLILSCSESFGYCRAAVELYASQANEDIPRKRANKTLDTKTLPAANRMRHECYNG